MRRPALTSLLAPFVLIGCGLVGEPIAPVVQNTCESSDDCVRGTCEPELGICIAGEPTRYPYYVDIVPAADASGRRPLARRVGPFLTSAEVSLLDLSMPRQVRVEGTLRQEGQPISALVTFSRRWDGDAVAARATVVQARTLPFEGPPDPSREIDFSVELLPGSVYDVYVEPQDDDRARLYPRSVGVIEVGATGGRVPLAYEGVGSLIEYALRGRLLDADGTPHEGLEVRCVDAETGAVVSSVATTDAEGAFAVWRDPDGASRWLLRISAPAAIQETGAFPRYTVDPSVLVPGPEGVVDILIPAAPETFAFRGRVEYRPAESTEPRAVGDATIQLRSSAVLDARTGLIGTYDIAVTSDEEGAYDVALPAGDYEIQVIPSDPELGILVQEQTVTGALLGHVLEVPVRTRTGGVVVAPDGEPLSDARVRATALGLAPPGIDVTTLARLARGSEVTTDAMGQFALGLDVGLYDVRVEPAAGSGWPWAVTVAMPVGAAAARFALGNVTVRVPVAVTGSVVYADDEAPLAGAEIRAFAAVGPDGAQRLVQVGQATAASDGTFRLLLPPEIAAAP